MSHLAYRSHHHKLNLRGRQAATEAPHKVDIQESFLKRKKKIDIVTGPILTGLVARNTEGNTFVEKDTL